MDEVYTKQVKLLLDVLPEVAKEEYFALHGGKEEIKKGLIFGLICSNRPTHELLKPRLHDQSEAFVNQFEGMATIAFSYAEYEATRLKLIGEIYACLTDADKDFLLSINRLEPDWRIYDFQDFPSVKWKLANLATFKERRPEDYQQHLTELEKILSSNL